MTTPLTGGLLPIHASLYAEGQPLDLWLLRTLSHNQELIEATFRPRHLVNDCYAVQLVACPAAGAMIGVWGRLPRNDGMTVLVRICTGESNSVAATVYAAATSEMPAHDWSLPDGSQPIGERLVGTRYLDSAEVAADATRQWYEMELTPPTGPWWYLSLWGVGDSGTSYLTVGGVSAIERPAEGAVV